MRPGLLALFFLVFIPQIGFSESQVSYIELEGAKETMGKLHLIVEANTFVPDFYQGRSEPSPGSGVRLTAIPIGVEGDLDKYSYYWTVNGTPLSSQPKTGSSSIVLRAPLFGNLEITVMIFSPDGKKFAEENQSIRLTSPSVNFYEENPLKGLGRLAIKSPYTLIGEESAIRAVPWFTSSLSLPNSFLEWTANNKVLKSESSDPLLVNLNRSNSVSDRYRLEFFLGNRINLGQRLAGNIEVLHQEI